MHESNESRVVSHVDDPLICAKPAKLEKFWMQNTKWVVIKRGEALSPGVPVVYLGFEYRSVHDGERRGFTVKLTAKYVDECLDMFNCGDQVQHSLFRAVVGKLQYIAGVRPDLMVCDKMLVIQTWLTNTCRFDTCQESVQIFQKETRELNLFLMVPALKPTCCCTVGSHHSLLQQTRQ